MSVELRLKHAFKGFDLDLEFALNADGITVLFGPSGSGKTTTINAIAGLLRPDEGRITVAGETLLDTQAGLFVPPRKRGVGYVFQDARLFPHLKVQDNLLFGWRRAGKPLGKAEIEGLTDLLGLTHLLDRRPKALSGGEKQRVALGRALAMRPRMLLLDEPMAALDEPRRMEILPYLEQIRAVTRIPIFYVTHNIAEVTRVADQMVILNQGRVAAAGSVYDIMSRLDLFPLTGRFEAGAVAELDCELLDCDDELTELELAGQAIFVPAINAEPGQSLRLRIRSRDVILALEKPQAISTNNILLGTVTGLREDPGPYVDVQVTCNGAPILARLTKRSVERLKLKRGKEVYAILKTATIDRSMLTSAQTTES